MPRSTPISAPSAGERRQLSKKIVPIIEFCRNALSLPHNTMSGYEHAHPTTGRRQTVRQNRKGNPMKYMLQFREVAEEWGKHNDPSKLEAYLGSRGALIRQIAPYGVIVRG